MENPNGAGFLMADKTQTIVTYDATGRHETVVPSTSDATKVATDTIKKSVADDDKQKGFFANVWDTLKSWGSTVKDTIANGAEKVKDTAIVVADKATAVGKKVADTAVSAGKAVVTGVKSVWSWAKWALPVVGVVTLFVYIKSLK